jgi:hypothetical protein
MSLRNNKHKGLRRGCCAGTAPGAAAQLRATADSAGAPPVAKPTRAGHGPGPSDLARSACQPAPACQPAAAIAQAVATVLCAAAPPLLVSIDRQTEPAGRPMGRGRMRSAMVTAQRCGVMPFRHASGLEVGAVAPRPRRVPLRFPLRLIASLPSSPPSAGQHTVGRSSVTIATAAAGGLTGRADSLSAHDVVGGGVAWVPSCTSRSRIEFAGRTRRGKNERECRPVPDSAPPAISLLHKSSIPAAVLWPPIFRSLLWRLNCRGSERTVVSAHYLLILNLMHYF